MADRETIYQLYVAANPVPDVNRLREGLAPAADFLASIEDPTEADHTDQVRKLPVSRPGVKPPWHSRGPAIAAAAAVVALIAVGIGVWLAAGPNDLPFVEPSPATTIATPPTTAPTTSVAEGDEGPAGDPLVVEDPVEAPTTIPSPSATAVIAGEPGSGPGLSWLQVDMPSVDAAPYVFGDGHQFYLTDDSLGVVFASEDGTSWEPVADATGAPLLVAQQPWSAWSGRHLVVTQRGESYTSARANTKLTVQVLIDGGSSQTQTLEANVPQPSTTTIVNVSSGLVAVGQQGYYVLGGLRVIDFGPLVMQVLGADVRGLVELVELDLSQETEALVVQTTDGSRETISAADVGLQDAGLEHDLAVSPSGLIGWYSPDGMEWVQVDQEGPLSSDRGGVTSLVGVDDGFLAVDAVGDLWFTSDGVTWQQVPGAGSQGALRELIQWSDQALARSDGGRLFLATSSGISPLPMSDTAPVTSRYGRAGAAGPAGIAYFVEVEPEGPFELLYSSDGANWNLGPLPDPTGDVYCCWFDLFGVAVGRDAVLVLEESSDGSGLALWLGRTRP